jgi:hypothetical protein
MKLRFMLMLVPLWPVLGSAQELQELWKADLREKYACQNFNREIEKNWVSQQGVVFLTPEEIAVYQVNKRKYWARLGARDTSGGAGNFFLDVKILDARDGRLLKSLNFPTNAELSKVLPTHDGRFIVRTGEVLYLYAPDFQQLASRSLPLKRMAPLEDWEINVTHSGQEVFLVHQQMFFHEQPAANDGSGNSGKSQADIEVLDADSLRVIKKFSVSNYMAHWSVGDRFLVGTHPTGPSHQDEFGKMDFDGQWTSLNSAWKIPRNTCSYTMDALDRQLIAVYGCNRLLVLSPSGERIFSTKAGANEFFASVANADSYLAAESDRPEVRFGNSTAKPIRIEVYDLGHKATLKWISVAGGNVYYDVSKNGDLAVVDGNRLTLYAKER